MKPEDIKLSVCVITYNQKKYIKQAIEGVLKQKTDFKYELIIGDDCSTDGTKDIVINYQKKYPDIIRLILHPKRNEGVPGKANFLSTLSAAVGKYIALLDGDDYWVGTNKLQKQVDFLEANPGYAICCHRVYIKKEGQKPKLYQDEYMPLKETTYDIETMAKYGNLVATPSVVYRNKLFSSFPSWFDQAPIGDYVLHLMNAQYGKVKYFPEPMAVYREHLKGAWGGQAIMTNAANMVKVLGLLLIESFDESVKKGLKDQLRQNRAIYLRELMQQDWGEFCKEFDKLMADDKAMAIALVEKMKREVDSIQASRTYKVMKGLKKIVKGK